MASSFRAPLIYKTNLLEITGINCFRCGNAGVPILPWASRTSTMINHPLTILRRSAAAAKPGLIRPNPPVPGGGPFARSGGANLSSVLIRLGKSRGTPASPSAASWAASDATPGSSWVFSHHAPPGKCQQSPLSREKWRLLLPVWC